MRKALPPVPALPKPKSAFTRAMVAAGLHKAKREAQRLFPGHRWIQEGERIFISSNKGTRTRPGFQGEMRNAQILRDLGYTVHLVPELARTAGRKYDALVNGFRVEFKNSAGTASTLKTHFLLSRSQAPNVFINLESSNLSRRQAIDALHTARMSRNHTDRNGVVRKGWDDINRFAGGTVILKLKGRSDLVYIDVNALNSRRP